MVVEALGDRTSAEIEVALLVVAVAVFDASGDVVGDEGFDTGADRVTSSQLLVVGAIAFQLVVGDSHTGRTVDEEGVQVVTNAATDRAVDALGALEASASRAVFAVVADVGFTTVYDGAALHVVTAVYSTADAIGVTSVGRAGELAHVVGDATTDTFNFDGGLNRTAGATSLFGTVASNNQKITLGSVNLVGTSSLDAGTEVLTVGDVVGASSQLLHESFAQVASRQILNVDTLINAYL